MSMSDKPSLKERVDSFRMMELPGQPQMMHMGTSYLVGDLWREICRLTAQAPRDHPDYNQPNGGQ